MWKSARHDAARHGAKERMREGGVAVAVCGCTRCARRSLPLLTLGADDGPAATTSLRTAISGRAHPCARHDSDSQPFDHVASIHLQGSHTMETTGIRESMPRRACSTLRHACITCTLSMKRAQADACYRTQGAIAEHIAETGNEWRQEADQTLPTHVRCKLDDADGQVESHGGRLCAQGPDVGDSQCEVPPVRGKRSAGPHIVRA